MVGIGVKAGRGGYGEALEVEAVILKDEVLHCGSVMAVCGCLGEARQWEVDGARPARSVGGNRGGLEHSTVSQRQLQQQLLQHGVKQVDRELVIHCQIGQGPGRSQIELGARRIYDA
jgi:hypothetical protein